MSKAILLALAAGLFTAMSSICQRRGALQVPASDGFSVKLLLQLITQPVWLLGIASMTAGFGCQAVALHFGSLALVQPILASELLFVFGYIAMASPNRVRRADWMAAAAMAAGLGVFLFTADPSGGQSHASGSLWFFGTVSALGLVIVIAVAALVPLRRGTRSSPARRAALLGVATGVSWGFLAAVIKEAGSHTGDGLASLLSNWSPYVLFAVGAASMILASNALHAGPLAASQPGFTIIDPLVASLLGVFIFKDRLQHAPLQIGVEIVAAAALVLGVVALSHSSLVHGEPVATDDPTSSPMPPAPQGSHVADQAS